MGGALMEQKWHHRAIFCRRMYSIFPAWCTILTKKVGVVRMTIRNIRPGDYEAVDRLLLQLHAVDVAGRPELFRQKDRYMDRENFEFLVQNPEILGLLAEKRGKAVGCCFVSMMDRSGMVKMKTAYIDLLVVDERHRRQGVGRALFQAVQKRSRRAGAQRVDLMVWSHNETAIRAYASYGMVPQRWVYEKKL